MARLPRRSQIGFTDAFVRNARAGSDGRRVAIYDGQTAGLELRVTAAGAKTWAFRYREVAGKTVRLVLGSYPAVRLKEARELALAARREVSVGGDPRGDRAAAQFVPTRTTQTFGDIAEMYLAAAARRNRASTIELDRQRLRTHLLAAFASKPLSAISRQDARALVEDIGARGHAVTANRVAALGAKLVKFANDELDIEASNPFLGFRSFHEKTTRARVLRDSELRTIWRALDTPPYSPISESMALCLQLCTLTLQRGQEVVGIDANELDLDQRIWVIPDQRTKNRREHVVPLSSDAVRILQRAAALAGHPQIGKTIATRPRPIFRSPRTDNGPVTRHALTRGMTRLCDELGVTDARPHDLRRTGATNITSERIGMPRFVVSAVLNHVSEMGGVTRIYDRNEYLADKRRALEAWANLVRNIAA